MWPIQLIRSFQLDIHIKLEITQFIGGKISMHLFIKQRCYIGVEVLFETNIIHEFKQPKSSSGCSVVSGEVILQRCSAVTACIAPARCQVQEHRL